VEVEGMVPRKRDWKEVEELMAGSSYLGHLFRLMQKADTRNWTILRRAYPQEAMEYLGWVHHTSDAIKAAGGD